MGSSSDDDEAAAAAAAARLGYIAANCKEP